jgi:hypothetical protein
MKVIQIKTPSSLLFPLLFILDMRSDSKRIKIPPTSRFFIRTMTQMLIIAIARHNQKNCKTCPFHKSYLNKNSNKVNSFSNSLMKYCNLLNSTDEKVQIKSNQ